MPALIPQLTHFLCWFEESQCCHKGNDLIMIKMILYCYTKCLKSIEGYEDMKFTLIEIVTTRCFEINQTEGNV